MRFAIWVFLLFHLFPLDALQITPNVVFLSCSECNFCQDWSLCLRGGDTAEVDSLKCLPILTSGLEVCALPKRVLQSLDFTVNRVLMKLFESSNIVSYSAGISFIANCHPYSSRDVL